MHCLLLYDISDDNKRNKIADACLDYGLDRIQYSAFAGPISRNHQEELFLKIQDLLDGRSGHIRLINICQTDWQGQLIHHQEKNDA